MRKKATQANITSEVFKIKEYQQLKPIKETQITADKINKLIAEVDNYKTITNDQLRALLSPIFGKQSNKILNKVHKTACCVDIVMKLDKKVVKQVLATQVKTTEPEMETIKELVFDNSFGGLKFEDNKFLPKKN